MFKELPGKGPVGKPSAPPLAPAPQAAGQANINPVIKVDAPKGRPDSPGKSALAPGQIKKVQGVKNAAEIAKNRMKASGDIEPADDAEGKVAAMRGAMKRLSTLPQPALKYRPANKPQKPMPLAGE